MKVIITGATGFIGEGVLIELIKHPKIEKILSVSRRPTGYTSEKLEEYLVPDFMKLSIKDAKLQGYDACFYCAGKSSNGMSNEEYRLITIDMPLHFIEAIDVESNPNLVFEYLSGDGANNKMDSFMNWMNVKGEAENKIKDIKFKKTFSLRPSVIVPIEGQKNVSFTQKCYGFFSGLAELFNKKSTTGQIGLAMINLALNPDYEHYILESSDIVSVANQPQ